MEIPDFLFNSCVHNLNPSLPFSRVKIAVGKDWTRNRRRETYFNGNKPLLVGAFSQFDDC